MFRSAKKGLSTVSLGAYAVNTTTEKENLYMKCEKCGSSFFTETKYVLDKNSRKVYISDTAGCLNLFLGVGNIVLLLGYLYLYLNPGRMLKVEINWMMFVIGTLLATWLTYTGGTAFYRSNMAKKGGVFVEVKCSQCGQITSPTINSSDTKDSVP